jgi:UDP-glucose 4-epimerase
MTAQRSVVTGGAGFIGSTLVDRLLADGQEVLVIDDLSTGTQQNLKSALRSPDCDLEVLDVRSPETTELIALWKPTTVFHLAAQIDVRASMEDPVFDLETNTGGTLRVLEGARLVDDCSVLMAGSGGTRYAQPEVGSLLIDEQALTRPDSPYGISKLVTEYYLTLYHRLYGLDVMVLALGNVYGPRQNPHGEAGVVAIFIGQMLAGDQCTIFGTGEQIRDYVYVDDVAEAFLVAGKAQPADLLLHVATGIGTSVNELYALVAKTIRVTTNPKREASRSGEPDGWALSTGQAKESLGWQAETSLAEGVARTMDWFRNN